MNLTLRDNDQDAIQVVSSGKSFQGYDRERLSKYFIPKNKSKEQVEKRLQLEKDGKRKPKKHHGRLENYRFDRQLFLDHIQQLEDGALVNWTNLARKFNFKDLHEKTPTNAGQILMAFAKEQGK